MKPIATGRRKAPIIRTLATLFFLFAVAAIFAVDWPAPEMSPRAVFGQNVNGRPSVGMVLHGESPVRAMDAGEVIFVGSANDSSGLPFTLGNWIAIDHGNGMVGVYGRLENLSTGFAKTLVEKGSVLGRGGKTGWIKDPGLYFSMIDRKERRWINPAVIAPMRRDTKPPLIRSVSLIGTDGASYAPATVKRVRQGTYRLVVDAVDAEDGTTANLAPNRFICLINGRQEASLHLETVAAIDGSLIVARERPENAATVFTATGAYDLGEVRIPRGRVGIEVIVRDAAGNERNAVFSVQAE